MHSSVDDCVWTDSVHHIPLPQKPNVERLQVVTNNGDCVVHAGRDFIQLFIQCDKQFRFIQAADGFWLGISNSKPDHTHLTECPIKTGLAYGFFNGLWPLFFVPCSY